MTSSRGKITLQKRVDSTSSHHCCVPFCTASARFNSYLSFHTFPKDKELLSRWIINIRRDKYTVSDSSRVCSRHFQATDLIQPQTTDGRRRLKKGAIPVLFHWNNYSVPAPRLAVWERTERPTLEDLTNDLMTVDDSPLKNNDHDYCGTAEPAALDLSLQCNEDLLLEIERLRQQLEDVTINNKFCLERFSASDDDIRFFTR